MASEEPLFWINGKAGSVKALMKYIVQDQRTIGLLNQQLRTYAVYTLMFTISLSAKADLIANQNRV